MEEYIGRHGNMATHIRKLFSNAKYRKECGEYVAEGTKLLFDAARSGADVTCVIRTEGTDVPLIPGAKYLLAEKDVFTQLSTQQAPQGAIFTCRIPEPMKELPRGLWLVLDGVQDPGNVGTVIRSAEAFGAALVVLAPGCADPFLHKTVRASMGSSFRQPVVCLSREEIIEYKNNAKIPLYTADMDGESPVDTLTGEDCIVVIGSEGRGASPELRAASNGIISIPMAGECESLNAAISASVIMWEHMRKR